MIRQFTLLVLIAALVRHEQRGDTQSASSTPNAHAAIEEADRLRAVVEKLKRETRLQDAVPFAERGLALREQVLGPVHPDVAASLNDLAELYRAQGAYTRAEPLLVRARDIREKALGPMHPAVAQSLNILGELYWATGAYGKAEPLYVRALGIREQALGPMHPDVAESLNNLAVLYSDQGTYARAEPFLVRALGILEKALGPMHPDVGRGLNNLAELYRDQGAYSKAEPLLVRTIDILEKALGPMHPDVANILNNLAGLYGDQGAYSKAEPLWVRALDIREKALGPMHPDVAQSLHALALLHWHHGAYARAEPLLVRALDIREQVLGPRHPAVAKSLHDLAGFYLDQGAYARAEPLLVRALDIREQALGPRHPAVAKSLNSLASLYRAQGAYGRAEPLYLRALDINEKTHGPMHSDVANILHNLAEVYRAQGAYGRAEPLHLRALDINEQVLGPMHPFVAFSLNNLAELYRAQGAYDKASPLLARALDIREQALGPMHPEVAQSLVNIAALHRDQAAYAEAKPLLVRALDIREQALGPMHPDVATSLNDLALLYRVQGAYAEAEPLLSRAADIRESQLHSSLAPLSESRQRALMALVQSETESLVSFHIDASPGSPRALELALTTVLRRQGRILDSLTEAQRTLRDHLTPPLRGHLDQLAQVRTQLVARLYAPAEQRAAAERPAAIQALRTRIEELEEMLSAASAEFRAQNAPVTLASVEAALPPRAMLIEFVRYRRFDVRAQPPEQEARYVAYLVTSHGPPRWVPLGEAAPIDAMVDAVLAALQAPVRTEATRIALQRLDALVMAPMRDQLTEVSHLIVAPDGKLNLVPFDALIDAGGHHEIDRYLISYLSSGRDLLRLGAHRGQRSPAVIVAGPDYGPPLRQPDPGAATFPPLPDAGAEATDLRRYFSTAPVTGKQATKQALAALVGPAILHVATHGFYARDPGATQVPGSRGSSGPPPAASALQTLRGMYMEIDGGAPSLSSSSDPVEGLDRAGLAMAGANQGADGIVTARELAGFDWWGTQLVVLSACESGLGAVAGDGVYGMRRALVLAGAESQVVSLWKVDDRATRALMRDYYGELSRGGGRAEALRTAKLHLLHLPRYAHPYYWGAFIPAGDWTALDQNTLPHPGPGTDRTAGMHRTAAARP